MSDCALCRGDLSTAIVVGTRARFGHGSRRVACRDCGLVQVSPQPSEEELTAFYRSHAYREEHGNVCIRWGDRLIPPGHPDHDRAYEAMGEHRARWSAKIGDIKPGSKVLDVGCGHGYVMRAFQAQGCEVWGIEPDEQEAERARRESPGCAVFTGTLNDYLDEAPDDFPDAFDAVVSYHVLEHVPDPVQTLTDMRGLLAPGGKVVVEVPNIYGVRSSLDDDWFQWVHLFDFSPHTLIAAMERAGLVVSHCEAEGVVVASALAGPVGRGGVPHGGEYIAGFLDCYRRAWVQQQRAAR